MKILAIETSTESATVALLVADALLEREVAGRTHSESLLPAIQALLAEQGLALSALDAIAFGAGPGAFTGLRLACGVAQGLALGLGKPAFAIGSLEALASQCAHENILVAVDARLSEVYYAAYRRRGDALEEILAPACALPVDVMLPAGEAWFGCGGAFGVHAAPLLPALGARLQGFDAAALPRAADVARLAVQRIRRGEVGDPLLAAPLYVRDKVAMTTAERLARGGKA